MLLSAYAADQDLFNRLWAYYKNFRNSNGVMHWKISGCYSVNQQNGATDAELDAAMALIVANYQWPNTTSPHNYKTDAVALITAIKNTETAPDGTFYNGDMWHPDCRNPSYQAPAYARIFKKFMSDNGIIQDAYWDNVATKTEALFAANAHSTSGLNTNWCTPAGPPNSSCSGSGTAPDKFGYDACRAPWRQAVDILWYGPTTAATLQPVVNRAIDFWITKGAANVQGGDNMNHDGSGFGDKNCAFWGPVGAQSLTASNTPTHQAFCNAMFTQNLTNTGANGYFTKILQVLGLFVQSGNFWNPYITTPQATLSVTPNSLAVASTSSINTVVVTSNQNWTISSNQSWITTSIANGANNGSFTINVADNITTGSRTGIVTISAGTLVSTINVTQEGIPVTLAVSTSIINLPDLSPTSAEISVSSNSSWSISSNQSWLTSSINGGTNNGNFTISATENFSSNSRIGIITITAGPLKSTISVNQDPSSTTPLVNTSTLNFSSTASNSASIDITTNNSWNISSSQAWLTTSIASGVGNGNFTISASVNSSTSERSGTITITDGILINTITVIQAATSITLSVNTSTINFASTASTSSSIAISSNSGWTISSDQTWLTSSPASGTGNGSFTITALANSSTTSRNGTITIKAGILTSLISISQAAANTTLEVNITNINFASTASTSSSIAISSNSSWTISSNQTWLTSAVASGTGNGSFTVAALANSSTTSRNGTITITAGSIVKTISVTQAAATTTNRNFTVRAKGVSGGEQIQLRINNQLVTTWTLTTSMANYTIASTITGTVRVQFINDAQNRDVQIDYLKVNNTTYQSENQNTNTGLYSNGKCGGGGKSEMMHCNGYIEYSGSSAARINGEDSSPEVEFSEEILLYPNPCINGKFTIQFNSQPIKVEILNLLGKRVLEIPVDGNTKIDVQGILESGMYILKVDNINSTKMKKFIVQ
jgi:endo-1,4-beta-D-glucanase Y